MGPIERVDHPDKVRGKSLLLPRALFSYDPVVRKVIGDSLFHKPLELLVRIGDRGAPFIVLVLHIEQSTEMPSQNLARPSSHLCGTCLDVGKEGDVSRKNHAGQCNGD